MGYNISITPAFERDSKPLLKKYKSLKDDLEKLFKSLELKPKQGISLGHKCYKIKMAIESKGKGKSGGARVITHLRVTETKIYLLTIYDKSEKEDIPDKELLNLLKLIA